MVTLYSDGDQGTLFLKTDQLDGETDWKLRKAVKMVHSGIKAEADVLELVRSDFACIAKYSSRDSVRPTARSTTFPGCSPTASSTRS